MDERPVTQPEICRAIVSRRLLEVVYNGKNRVVEPYCHGFAADGAEMLVGFQRAGGSESGQQAGWKAMAVDRIEHLTPLDVPFIADQPDYRAGRSKNVVSVHCYVEAADPS